MGTSGRRPAARRVHDVPAGRERPPGGWRPPDPARATGEALHEAIARAARTTWLVLEVGDGQAPAVAAMLRRHGYDDVRVSADVAGRERVVEGRRP